MEELNIGNITFNTYDLGGHTTARRLWKDYCQVRRTEPVATHSHVALSHAQRVDAICFLVDANARDRFGESKIELDGLLGSEELANVPFVVLGNKIDIPRAASEDELRAALGLSRTTGKGVVPLSGIRPVEVFMCSVVLRSGYSEAFQWLSQYI
jgi:GTPase SAR1 family protein